MHYTSISNGFIQKMQVAIKTNVVGAELRSSMRASLLFLSSQKEIAMGILAIIITFYMRAMATQ